MSDSTEVLPAPHKGRSPATRQPRHKAIGPAMLALASEGQREFVRHFVHSGGVSASESYRSAGYACKAEGADRVGAHRLLADPKVQDALLEYARQHLRAGGIRALAFLQGVIGDDRFKTSDQVKAAEILAKASGVAFPAESRLVVEHTESREEQVQRVIDALGVGMARQIMGKLVDDVLDVEAREIDAPPPPPVNLESPGEYRQRQMDELYAARDGR
jgi:hypothetical protein